MVPGSGFFLINDLFIRIHIELSLTNSLSRCLQQEPGTRSVFFCMGECRCPSAMDLVRGDWLMTHLDYLLGEIAKIYLQHQAFKESCQVGIQGREFKPFTSQCKTGFPKHNLFIPNSVNQEVSCSFISIWTTPGAFWWKEMLLWLCMAKDSECPSIGGRHLMTWISSRTSVEPGPDTLV